MYQNNTPHSRYLSPFSLSRTAHRWLGARQQYLQCVRNSTKPSIWYLERCDSVKWHTIDFLFAVIKFKERAPCQQKRTFWVIHRLTNKGTGVSKEICVKHNVLMSRFGKTHWGRDANAAILETIFSNSLSCMTFLFQLKLKNKHYPAPRAQLTCQYWLR